MVQRKDAAKGFCGLVVDADDFMACFQYKWEAERFCEQLKRRMGYFGLELQEDKSRLIKSGGVARQDTKEKGRGIWLFGLPTSLLYKQER